MDLRDEEVEEERYEAALHHTVGKLCQHAAVNRMHGPELPIRQTQPVTFTKHYIAFMAEVTWTMMEHWSKDLEAFAKHAKRSTVNADDVRLLARRSPALIALLEKVIDPKPDKTINGKRKTIDQPCKDSGAGPSSVTEEHLHHDSIAAASALVNESAVADDYFDDCILLDDIGHVSSPGRSNAASVDNRFVSPNVPLRVAEQEDDLDAAIYWLTDDELTKGGTTTAVEVPAVVEDSDDDLWSNNAVASRSHQQPAIGCCDDDVEWEKAIVAEWKQ